MIRSAAAKLALWYLAIIMLISGVFSTVIYNISFGQLAQNVDHQRAAIARIPLPPALEGRRIQLNAYLDEELDSAQTALLIKLATLNTGMLLLGTLAAYLLARRTLQPIQAALEAQGRFTADASHELRTPLTAMRTEIEVALRDKQLSASDARELLGSNLEEIAKLETLSAGLLRLARSENGLDPAIITRNKVRDVFSDAAERYGAVIAARHIELDIKAGPETVSGDRDSLVELIAILLDNSIKYSPEGSTVTLASAPTSGYVRLSVADQGMGIKASDLPYIFNRFYRADRSRARTSAGGYGLGLSIAKRIVDLHHGAITVESSPGKGSTFVAKLPARQTTPSPQALSPYGALQSTLAKWYQKLREILAPPTKF
jgi:signal transduction histidine kinase